MIEQEAQQLNQQIQLIEQNTIELQDLNKSLDEIKQEESKEILAGLGKGIYLPVKITDKNLIVEVGNKIFVKKTIPETKELIKEQLLKLNQGKLYVMEKLNGLQVEINQMLQSSEEKSKEKKDKK